MKTVFILQNQRKQFLSKQNEWVDGRDANTLFKTAHKDEALNQLFEASSKDYTQRVQLLECRLNDKNLPVIPEDQLPEPAPRAAGNSAHPSESPASIAAAGYEVAPE